MTGPNLLRVCAEYAESDGSMYAVDKSTGQIRKISLAIYTICRDAGLLDGYHMRLTESAARTEAVRVMREIAGRN